MGMDYSLYVGPVAICVPGKKVTESLKQGVCFSCHPNQKYLKRSKASGKDKFCSKCGSPLEDLIVEKVGTHDWGDIWKVTDKMDESLSCFRGEGAEYKEHIFVPDKLRNRTNDDYPLYWDTVSEFHVIEPEDISSEIRWFRDNYAKEIELLEEEYGKENVTTTFLIVGKWS